MTIGPISLPVSAIAATAPVVPATTTTAAGAAGATSGSDFANVLQGGLDNLNKVQGKADDLALQAATGTLQNPHDLLIASTQASLATDLTVALRNKALEAFTEIMRMSV
jgi:flagellar hook-basal body complex protein FliE